MTSATTDRLAGFLAASAIKTPCRVATTANITLSATPTIDGVAVVAGDRVLVKDQTDTTENGIYVVDSGSWTRAKDFDGSKDVVDGTLVYVRAGTANQGFWYASGTDPIDVDTDAITFTQASSVLATVSAFVQTIFNDSTASDVLTTLGVSSFMQTVLPSTTAASARLKVGGTLQIESTMPGLSNSGATVIPSDNSIPQNNEGDQYMDLSFTPQSTASTLLIDVVTMVANSTANQFVTSALFSSSSTNALRAAGSLLPVANNPTTFSFKHRITGLTTTARTFSVRIGTNSTGVVTFNGFNSTGIFNGVAPSSLTITETLTS
jgi:hypothetical protein